MSTEKETTAKEANSKLLQSIIQTALLTFVSALIMGFLAYLGWLGTTLVSISNNQEKILHEMGIREKEKEKLITVLTQEIHNAFKSDKDEKPLNDGEKEVIEDIIETKKAAKEVKQKDSEKIEFEEYQKHIQQRISIPRERLHIQQK